MFPSSFSLSFHSTQLHDSWDIFFLSHFCKHSWSNIARLMETRNKLKEKSVDFGNEEVHSKAEDRRRTKSVQY